jgi:hypothetical protein
LIAPKGGLIIATRTPVMTWGATATAVRYQVAVKDFTAINTLMTAVVTTTTFTVPNAQALANGNYFWQVTALDAAGNPGTASALNLGAFRVTAP